MAPVIDYFKNYNNDFDTIVAVTAQHRQMLDQVLNIFNIVPDFDFNLMSNNQTLSSITSKIVDCVSNLLDEINPSMVFVQGDTTTTFASSLSAFYKKIPVCHLEAGLRTQNKYSPFPEEMNRRMTSLIASYHFAPTVESKDNLVNEGIDENKILITGNTVIDALNAMNSKLDKYTSEYAHKFKKQYGIYLNNNVKNILVTCHRRESFGKGFESICEAIKIVAENKDIQFIFPVHLNPLVQEPVNRILRDIVNVHLIPPQDYIPFVFLMKNSHIILTDSGGIQEEAPSFGKPVLVLRDNTERPEGVTTGVAKLIGIKKENIISQLEELINSNNEYSKMANSANPYGDGLASERIFNFISQNFT